MAETVVRGDLLDRGYDGLLRCFWGGGPEEYRRYHDVEWGRPVHDDSRLFEKICLEGFQSGLSWLTILRKREAFRAAFAEFDISRVANYDHTDIEELVQDAAIVRHRGKIASTVNNAQRCIELQQSGTTLAELVWQFQPPKSSRPRRMTREWLMEHPTTAESLALSKELKRRGWSFVGPTTIYAFMQSVGIVNDHQSQCHVRAASGR